MKKVQETDLESHYAFGENWSDFADTLSSQQIENSVDGLQRLFPDNGISKKSFLDIGCGSGLSSLAAIRLGAAQIHATDIDPVSVKTTEEVLKRHAALGPWSVEEASILDINKTHFGSFDIVYSWGVLHHTGAMFDAIDKALSHVATDGFFAIALYRKTAFCGAWRRIKRIYAHSGPIIRLPIRTIYWAMFALGLIVTGRSPITYAKTYARNRGMTWKTDIEDWLGGYPYESISSQELETYVNDHGFTLVRSFTGPSRLGGLLGSGCDEYVFKRNG